ncbi:uncharacterized protein ACIBXB_011746 [Morphnus guianensis]
MLCTSFCFGSKSPFSSIAWGKTTPLSTWWKGCKGSSSEGQSGLHKAFKVMSWTSWHRKLHWGDLHRQKIPIPLRMILHIQTPGVVKSQLSCLAPVFPDFRRGCCFLPIEAMSAAAGIVTRKGLIPGSRDKKKPSPSQRLPRHSRLLLCLPALLGKSLPPAPRNRDPAVHVATGTGEISVAIQGCPSCLLLLSSLCAHHRNLVLPWHF